MLQHVVPFEDLPELSYIGILLRNISKSGSVTGYSFHRLLLPTMNPYSEGFLGNKLKAHKGHIVLYFLTVSKRHKLFINVLHKFGHRSAFNLFQKFPEAVISEQRPSLFWYSVIPSVYRINLSPASKGRISPIPTMVPPRSSGSGTP